MATKTGNKGRYICKVGFYDIYAKDSFKPKKTSKYNYAKADVASTEYNLVHAKKVVEKGFKTKDLAVSKAKELLGENFRQVYNIQ
jgi:hypothetical protein